MIRAEGLMVPFEGGGCRASEQRVQGLRAQGSGFEFRHQSLGSGFRIQGLGLGSGSGSGV